MIYFVIAHMTMNSWGQGADEQRLLDEGTSVVKVTGVKLAANVSYSKVNGTYQVLSKTKSQTYALNTRVHVLI